MKAKVTDLPPLPLEPRRAYFIYCGGARDQRTGRPVPSFEKFGAGWRLIYVVKVGRKWVSLCDPTTLDMATIHIREWPSMKASMAGTRSAEQIIRRQRLIRKKLGMNVPAAVNRLIKELNA